MEGNQSCSHSLREVIQGRNLYYSTANRHRSGEKRDLPAFEEEMRKMVSEQVLEDSFENPFLG